MKIYTKIVMDWDCNVLEEEHYEYDGPVAECKSGGTNTVQSADPWSGVQDYLKGNPGLGIAGAYPEAQRLYNSGGPEIWQGRTYALQDPLEQEGLDYIRNITPSMYDLAGNMFQTTNSMLNAPDVANNHYVGGMADTITNRLNRNLTENLLPATSQGAITSGQLGGSRQGIAQGQAIGRTQEALGDSLSQLFSDAYGKGLDQQFKGITTAPVTQQQMLSPGQTLMGLGAENRGWEQLAINDEMARFNAEQLRPEAALDSLLARLGNAAPYGSTSTTSGGGSGGVGGALGGAMLGAGLAGPLGGLGASMGLGMGAGGMGPSAMLAAGAANPLMWPLMILGGIAGAS